MRRNSLSDSRLSRSAAVHGSLRSRRMSSGPSLWKLKPRSGSSSCTEERPRSNTMPFGGRPIRSAARSSCAKLVCSSITVMSGGAGSWAKRVSAEASRSMPSSRPPGRRRSISARAYPPPPSVASMNACPGVGGVLVMTSCKSTGRCPDGPDGRSSRGRPRRSRARGTSPLGHLVLNARVLLRRRLADSAPPPVFPDLDQVVDAHNPGHARDPGVLPLVGGQDDSSLGVEFALPGGAEHHAGEAPLLRRRRRAQPQPLLLRPFLGRIDLQATLGALGDDGPTRELFPKTGGDRHSSLGVDRVPVGAKEHQESSPAVSLSPLFPTLCHPHAERYHCDRCLSTNSD